MFIIARRHKLSSRTSGKKKTDGHGRPRFTWKADVKWCGFPVISCVVHVSSCASYSRIEDKPRRRCRVYVNRDDECCGIDLSRRKDAHDAAVFT